MSNTLPALGIEAGDPAAMTAAEAAQRIRAWHDALRHLSSMAEAQVMAAAWAIQRELPDRPAFDAFVGATLDGVMTPDQAWLSAQTWDAARSNRGIRDLARTHPDRAVEFMRTLVDAGQADRVANLDEDDRAIADLAAAPPREFRSRLRRLYAAERHASAGRNPADVQRIETLTEERDAALAQVADADKVAAHPAAALTAATSEMQEEEKRLAQLAERVDQALAGGAPSQAARDRLLRTVELAMSSLERIAGAAMGLDD